MSPQQPHHPDTRQGGGESLDDLAANLHRLTEQARSMVEQPQPGTELVTATVASPDAIKAQVARQRSLIARATKELRAQQAALEARLADELAAVRAVLAPLETKVKQLNELVWTVNLYLGREEEIVTLLDGEPAAAHTPICVRQMVLSMDEETMLAADTGGIDFRNLDDFDDWVTNPDHLRQVLPEQRGVVVLVPRRRGRDYGDPMTSATLNEKNKRSYWLIRNGNRLFRMTTDFSVGDLLTPGRDEFADFFTEPGRSGRVPLEPGSSTWLRAEEKADERKRHYMRAALILQGLVDRTTVFAPLPAPTVSLLQPASYDAGHVQLICDADHALTEPRTPFYQWLTDHNCQLRPGMRVVGAFSSSAFNAMRVREGHYRGCHDRLHPQRAENPVTGEMYMIEERRDDGGLVIRYDRAREIQTRDGWGHVKFRRAGTRASCILYPRDTYVLPIDLVSVEEMRGYLRSRTERHAYLDMVPLLQAAITAKEDEAAVEEPFRAMLAGQLALTHDLTVEEAAAHVTELVHWWKHTTVHFRPLISSQTPEVVHRATREMLAEYSARQRAAAAAERDAKRNSEIVARMREEIPDAIVIARKRDGSYIAYSPQPRTHPEPIASRTVYVREHTTGRRIQTIAHRDWVFPSNARIESWTILWTSPTWDGWNRDTRRAIHLTDPEIDILIDTLRRHGAAHHTHTYDHRTGARTTAPTGTPALISSTRGRGGRHDLRLYLDDGTTFTPPARLLTTRLNEVGMPALTLSWRRTNGGGVEHTITTYSSFYAWRDHLLVAGDTGLRPPWRDETVLWSEPDLVARTEANAAALQTARGKVAALNEAARSARSHVVAVWEACAERAAYKKFLDDYLDPDLWEGHRKTIQKTLCYPHHANYRHDGLSLLLHRLVEDGHDLTGHTVATAAALLNEDIDLPEDILHLPITNETNKGTSQ